MFLTSCQLKRDIRRIIFFFILGGIGQMCLRGTDREITEKLELTQGSLE